MIEQTGHQAFAFFRDFQKYGKVKMSNKEITKKCLEEVNKSDGIFIFIDSDEKSEGMLLEAGYAKAKNKKMILVIKKGIDLRFLKSIADEVVEFNEFSEVKDLIHKLL